MRVHHGLPDERLPPAALTIGSFDGVHLGHQAVIRRVVDSGGLTPVLITFEPHPRCVLDPDHCPKSITTLEEKLRLFEPLGIEHAVVLLFTRDLAAQSAGDFMGRLLDAVDLRRLVTGHDFALGHKREGDLDWLRGHAAEHGYEVDSIGPLAAAGSEVHSSEIRRLVTLGEVEPAAALLGREFSLVGTVEQGHQVGRQLGFPTANVSVTANKLVPGTGVYAGRARQGERTWAAAIDVGYRPQFGGTDLTIEAFLLDFEGDLYQQRMEVAFTARLRDDAKFASTEDLVAQMRRDVEETRRILG